MRATGIVRRIDDLGRVTIPKEIRRTLQLREGDPLEIYVDHTTKSVTFQKYDMNGEIADQIEDIVQSHSDTLTGDIIATLTGVIDKLRGEENEKN